MKRPWYEATCCMVLQNLCILHCMWFVALSMIQRFCMPNPVKLVYQQRSAAIHYALPLHSAGCSKIPATGKNTVKLCFTDGYTVRSCAEVWLHALFSKGCWNLTTLPYLRMTPCTIQTYCMVDLPCTCNQQRIRYQSAGLAVKTCHVNY